MTVLEFLALLAVGFVVLLFGAYKIGKDNGYYEAQEEMKTKQTADQFAQYINQLAQGGFNGSSQG